MKQEKLGEVGNSDATGKQLKCLFCRWKGGNVLWWVCLFVCLSVCLLA